MNIVVLMGRLTKDPELRYTNTGTAVCEFTLAVDKQLSNEKRQEFQAQGKPTADFINIQVWNRPAETAAQYLRKGARALVNGRLDISSYDNERGERQWFTRVTSNNFQIIDWPEQAGGGNFQGGQYQSGAEPFGAQQGGNKAPTDFSGIEGFTATEDDNIPF